MKEYDMTLTQYINFDKKITDLCKKKIIYQILKGIHDSSNLLISHRDLKPDNILINERDTKICICDWGLSKFFNKKGKINMSGEVQTFHYRSPELLAEEKHCGIEIDMWSVGIIILELMCNCPPFLYESRESQYREIFKNLYSGDPIENKYYEKILNVDCISVDDTVTLYHRGKRISIKPTERINNIRKYLASYKGNDIDNLIDLVGLILHINPKKRAKPYICLNHPFFDELRESEIFHDNTWQRLTSSIENRKIDIRPNQNNTIILDKHRKIIINWIIEVCDKHCPSIGRDNLFFLTMYFIDALLSNDEKGEIVLENLQGFVLACLMISSKIVGNYTLDSSDCSDLSKNFYSVSQIEDYEINILEKFGFNVCIPTEMTYLEILSNEYQIDENIMQKSIYLLYDSIKSDQYRHFKQEILSTASLIIISGKEINPLCIDKDKLSEAIDFLTHITITQ
jgi:serine/threonine protein kinase